MAKRKSPKPPAAASAKKVSRQLVVTLSGSGGKIAKIEELGLAGKRRSVSEAEFATFAGKDDLNDVCEALEHAYLAGIKDAFIENDGVLDNAPHEPAAPRESFGEKVLRAGIRQIIFRRAIRDRVERADDRIAHNGPAQ